MSMNLSKSMAVVGDEFIRQLKKDGKKIKSLILEELTTLL